MALKVSDLSGPLLSLFTSPPDNIADCATAWAAAMAAYSASLDPPSTALASAATALQGKLVTAFTDGNDNSGACDVSLLESAFAEWAKLVAEGMAELPSKVPVGTVVVAVQPPGEIGFCSIGTQDDYASASDEFADKIDTWVKTGFSSIELPTVPVTYTLALWN